MKALCKRSRYLEEATFSYVGSCTVVTCPSKYLVQFVQFLLHWYKRLNFKL